jgi:hypothetical protein
VGPEVNANTQQSAGKINANCAYLANYWAPHFDTDTEEHENDNENDRFQQQASNISDATVQRNLRATILEWIRKCLKRNNASPQPGASSWVLDSGATSHFLRPEEDLPITGKSSKIVKLPDGSAIQTAHTTLLPFDTLSEKA